LRTWAIKSGWKALCALISCIGSYMDLACLDNFRTIFCFKQNIYVTGGRWLLVCDFAKVFQGTGDRRVYCPCSASILWKVIDTQFASTYIVTFCLDKTEYSCHQAPYSPYYKELDLSDQLHHRDCIDLSNQLTVRLRSLHGSATCGQSADPQEHPQDHLQVPEAVYWRCPRIMKATTKVHIEIRDDGRLG
jgi:hypothetical protein